MHGVPIVHEEKGAKAYEDSFPVEEGSENLRSSFASFLLRKVRQKRAKSAIAGTIERIQVSLVRMRRQAFLFWYTRIGSNLCWS